MEYEKHLGLRREKTFEDVRNYILTENDQIKYPDRTGTFLQQSHIYGQVTAAMRNYAHDAQVDQAKYRESDEQAPYQPPKRPPRDNTDPAGPPPGHPPPPPAHSPPGPSIGPPGGGGPPPSLPPRGPDQIMGAGYQPHWSSTSSAAAPRLC